MLAAVGPTPATDEPSVDVVVPAAMVTASGQIAEVNDGRGKRLLDEHPLLAAYARAAIACELGSLRFVWAEPPTGWLAMRIARQPAAAGTEPAVLVEAVEV